MNEVSDMATAIKLSAVEEWLSQTQGMEKVRAIEGGSQSITDEDLLSLARNCTWAELSDDADLCSGGVYHTGLVMGWGDMIEYCQSSGESDSSKVYFINAYR